MPRGGASDKLSSNQDILDERDFSLKVDFLLEISIDILPSGNLLPI